MELVYLWVEEYKNIKRQGFNFSSKFDCTFHDKYELDEDGKEKLKEGCELEIKPKKHIENFFGDNINVTAIVGKNGSGKSSVSEMILSTIPHKQHSKYIIVVYSKYDNKYHSYGNIKNFEFKGIETISTLNIEIISSGVEICANNNRNYNHNIVYMNGINLDFRTFEKYAYSDDDNNIFVPKYIHQYQQNLNLFKSKTFFYKFNKVRLFLKEFKNEEIVNDINQFSEKYKNNKKIHEKLISLDKVDSLDNTIKKLLIRYCSLNNVTREDMDAVLEIRNCFEIHQEYYPGIPKVIDIIEALSHLKTHKLQESIDIQNNIRTYFEFDIEDKSLSQLWIFENFFDIPNFIGTKKENLPLFDLELYDSKKDMIYNLLSHGEKQYMRLLIEIISNRSSGDLSSNREPKLYFFDEVETSLHPEWQKNIFNDICNIFRILERNVHLIFLTHSPFLLSDIPKQNIILLDKDEKGNCKVVDELKEKQQTFGANIHTLLSDSFFMKDGLMGEFAKSKIEEVVNFLQDKKSEIKNHHEASKIINILGEPILNMKLQRMLEEYRNNHNIESEEDIKKQIAELQAKLEEKQNNG